MNEYFGKIASFVNHLKRSRTEFSMRGRYLYHISCTAIANMMHNIAIDRLNKIDAIDVPSFIKGKDERIVFVFAYFRVVDQMHKLYPHYGAEIPLVLDHVLKRVSDEFTIPEPVITNIRAMLELECG